MCEQRIAIYSRASEESFSGKGCNLQQKILEHQKGQLSQKFGVEHYDVEYVSNLSK